MSALQRIVPECIDNRYRGHPLALWLFVPITLQKLAVSLTHLFTADGGAQSITTMPLDTYPASAAQNIVGLMARQGIEQLMFAMLLLLVLLRYRAMIPLMYVLIVAHYVATKGVAQMKPLVVTGTSGANTPMLVIAIMSVAGLVLSLVGRRYADHSSWGHSS